MSSFQPPYDYKISLGGVEPFDPRETSIEDYALQKNLDGRQELATAINRSRNELPDFGGELYIVQLQGPPSNKDLKKFKDNHNISLRHPLSTLTYLEKLTDSEIQKFKNLKNQSFSGIRAVFPYWTELKTNKTRISTKKVSFGIHYDESIDDIDNLLNKINDLLKELSAKEENIIINDAGDDIVIYVEFEDKVLLDLIAAIEVVKWVNKIGETVEYNLNASGITQSGNQAISQFIAPIGEDVRFANEKSHPIWGKKHAISQEYILGQRQLIGFIDVGELDLNHNFLRHKKDDNDLVDPSADHRKVEAYHMPQNLDRQSNHAMMVIGSALGSHIQGLDSIFHQYRGGAPEARLIYVNREFGNNSDSFVEKFVEFKKVGSYVINRSMGQRSIDRVTYNELAREIDEFVYNNEEYVFINAIPNRGQGFTLCGPIAKNSIAVGGINEDFERVNDESTHQFTVDSLPSQVIKACDDEDGNRIITIRNSDGTTDYIRKRDQDDWFTLDVPPVRVSVNHVPRDPHMRSTSEDLRLKPDILAYSVNITSSTISFESDTKCDKTGLSDEIIRNDDNYLERGGTSLAAPHVAAAAAQIRQYFQDGWYKPIDASGERRVVNFDTIYGTLIKAVLLNASVPLPGRESYPFPGDGWGRLQLNRTLYFDPGEDENIESGEVSYFKVHPYPKSESRSEIGVHPPIPIHLEQDIASLKITLVFNDYPGKSSDFFASRNQYSLVLYKLRADGLPEKMYLCNKFNEINDIEFSKLTTLTIMNRGKYFPGRMPDRSRGELNDNVRQIVVKTADAGVWKLCVWCHHVHKINSNDNSSIPKPSGFSVVISGRQP